MDQPASQSAFMSALITEHYVLQSAISTSVNEAASRATLYVLFLSSVLVAMGFAMQSRVFLPFVATVLPVVFVFGVFTVLRLVDNALDTLFYLAGIARIRRYYRTLAPEGTGLFAAHDGRWPEQSKLALRRGPLVLLFTPASMIAFINSLVAGAGVTLLTHGVLGNRALMTALVLGVVAAIAFFGAFLAFQRWRYGIFDEAS
jgi:hypothetical protein